MNGFDYACKIIDDGGAGKWNRPCHIDTFSYINGKYKVVWLNIDAHVQEIQLSSALHIFAILNTLSKLVNFKFLDG